MNHSSNILIKLPAEELIPVHRKDNLLDESSEKIKVIENEALGSDITISEKTDFLDTITDENSHCRMCFQVQTTADDKLIRPCACRGSLAWVHSKCILRWLAYSKPELFFTNDAKCEICHQSLVVVFETEMVYNSSNCCYSVDQSFHEFLTLSTILLLFYLYFYLINYCLQLIGEQICSIINLIFLLLWIVLVISYVWNFFWNLEKNTRILRFKSVIVKEVPITN